MFQQTDVVLTFFVLAGLVFPVFSNYSTYNAVSTIRDVPPDNINYFESKRCRSSIE